MPKTKINFLEIYQRNQLKIDKARETIKKVKEERKYISVVFCLAKLIVFGIAQRIIQLAILFLGDTSENYLAFTKFGKDAIIVCNNSFCDYKKKERGVRLFSKTVFAILLIATIITSGTLYLFFPGKPYSKAATYNFNQASWGTAVPADSSSCASAGGEWDAVNSKCYAEHNTDRVNWATYDAKDANLSAGADLTLSAASGSTTDTTAGDFGNGAQGNTYVSGDSVVLMLPPGAPTGLGVTGGNALADLIWTAPAAINGGTIDYYKIYRSDSTGTETFLTNTPNGTAVSYQDTSSLTNGITYYYKVSAHNIAGESAESGEDSDLVDIAPAAVQSLASTGGNATAQVTWSAPASNGGSAILHYHVYRSTSTGFTPGDVNRIGDNVSASPYNDTGLTNGTTYYYKVAAYNIRGDGATTSETSAIPSTVPGAVQSLASTGGNATAQVTWSAPASNGGSAVLHYHVYRSASTGFTPGAGNLIGDNVSASPYNDTGLTNGTTYYYKVSAVNAIGEGSQSAEANATPQCTVVIGTQTWMCYNMNVGTLVAGSGNQGTSCSSIQKYCYSNTEANCTTDGGLYQWNQAMCGSTTPGVQGICPSGFHIPTDAEFKTLVEGQATAGCESSTGWQCSPAGTNLKSSGSPYFYGILAGFRFTDGAFYNRGTNAYFWSSSESATNAWYRKLESSYATVDRNYHSRANGFSVRCLKD